MRIDRHQEGPRMRQYKKRQRGRVLKIAIGGAGIVVVTLLSFGVYQGFFHQGGSAIDSSTIAVSNDNQMMEASIEEKPSAVSVSDLSDTARTGSDPSLSLAATEDSIGTGVEEDNSSDKGGTKADIGKSEANDNKSGTDSTQEHESSINELEKKSAYLEDRDFMNRIENMSLGEKICSLIITSPQIFDDNVSEGGKTTLIDDSVKENLKSKPVCGLMMNETNIEYTQQLQNMCNEAESFGKKELIFPMFIMMYGKNRQIWEESLRINLNAYWEKEDVNRDVYQLPMAEILKEYGFNLYCVEDLKQTLKEIDDCRTNNIQACIVFSEKEEDDSDSFLKGLDSFQASLSDGMEMIMVPVDLFSNVNTDSTANHIVEDIRIQEGLEDVVIMVDTINTDSWDESSAVSALKAGADVIVTEDFDGVVKAITAAVRNDELVEDRIDESLYRVFKAKQ